MEDKIIKLQLQEALKLVDWEYIAELNGYDLYARNEGLPDDVIVEIEVDKVKLPN